MLRYHPVTNKFVFPLTVALLLSLLIPTGQGCTTGSNAPEHLRILFTTDTRGNFTPCGGAGGPEGGMERRSTAINEAVADAPGPVLLVDTGNFSTGFGTDLERTKAEFTARAMAELGYHAVNVGTMDAKMARLGVLRYRDEHGLPLTSAGFTFTDEDTGERLFSYTSSIVVDFDGFKVGIIGHPLDDLEEEELGFQHTPDVPAPELIELMESVYTQGRAKVLIVLTDLSTSWQDANIVGSRFRLASVIIAGSSAPTEYIEEKTGDQVSHPVIITRAASWGRSLGILDLDLSRSGGIIGYSLRYVDLDEDIEKDPMLAELTEEYIEAIDREPSGVPEIRHTGYIGSDACMECHGGQYEHWTETRHFEAWDTLEETGRIREAACVPCHVTGFVDLEAVPERMVPDQFRGVGCEACHGPGRIHIDYQAWLITGQLTGEPREEDFEDPIIRIPPEETCTRCHVKPHDEGWLYPIKIDRIRHD